MANSREGSLYASNSNDNLTYIIYNERWFNDKILLRRKYSYVI